MAGAAEWIYMDYAATAAVRPPAVAEAVADYLTRVGATPGRGGHRLAVEAGRILLRCRKAIAKLFGIPGDPGRIAFTFNATHALNTALWGVLRRGDVVVTTAYDHNAVLRPVHALERERGVEARMLRGAPDGSVDLEEAMRLLDGARLLVLNAASNVLGTVLPVRELGRLAHDAGALVLVDAAQLGGHLPLDVEADGIDLLAFTGHKGLLGPQGTGGLWVREGVELEPLLRGGTGGNSLLRSMPESFPDHLEAGTLNGPGLAGLLAGVEWVLARTPDAVHRHEAALKARLHDGLRSIPGVRVHSPAAPDGVAIVTITVAGMDPSTLARRLDQEHGVLTRAGLHCAPEVHRLIGTWETGAVRFSLGWASRAEEVDRTVEAVGRLVGA
ncbi:MAG TPA: aminotransferase class V-fold PLP-dependent enzyme [Longimicrobiales bacterium]